MNEKKFMDESNLKQESKETAPEPKLFGLPRSLAGALIGFLLFILVSTLAWTANIPLLQLILLFGGHVTVIVTSNLTDTSTNAVYNINKFFYYSILFIISSIPYSLFGFLTFSKKSAFKFGGIFMLILYFFFSTCIGFVFYMFAQD